MHLNPRIDALLGALNHPSLPGIDLSLARMTALLAALGNPQEHMPPAIHVAGTNGKGSTMAMLRQVYETAGYRVHAYHSPHLVHFNERIVLGGQEIDDARLEHYLARIADATRAIPVTFFEATTAAAFLSFAEVPADLLLLEVGLGGRLDATNLVTRVIASVITPIGLDHREFLGDSLAGIAREKAGILRHGVPAVTTAQDTEVMATLHHIAPHIIVAPVYLGMLAMAGAHQRQNAGMAAAVVRLLQPQFPVDAEAMQTALAHALWPGRLQQLTRGMLVAQWGARGPVMLDGGHNAHAAQALAAWASGVRPVVMICGLMARKDPAEFLAALRGAITHAAFIPIPHHADSHRPETLAAVAHTLGMTATACATLDEAVAALKPVGQATLLVAGSLYLVGEMLKNHG